MMGEDVDFYGSPGDRLVSALILIVDVAPEITNDLGEVLTGPALIEAMAPHADALVRKRVLANLDLEYLSKGMLEPIFSLAFNPKRLLAVRVAINKIDVLRDLASGKHLALDGASPVLALT